MAGGGGIVADVLAAVFSLPTGEEVSLEAGGGVAAGTPSRRAAGAVSQGCPLR